MKAVVPLMATLALPVVVFASSIVDSRLTVPWETAVRDASFNALIEYLGTTSVEVRSNETKRTLKATAYRLKLIERLPALSTTNSRSSGLSLVSAKPAPNELLVIDVHQAQVAAAFAAGAIIADTSSKVDEPAKLEVGKRYLFFSNSYNEALGAYEGGPEHAFLSEDKLKRVRKILAEKK